MATDSICLLSCVMKLLLNYYRKSKIYENSLLMYVHFSLFSILKNASSPNSLTRLAVRSNFWVWVPHNSLSLSFSGARTQKEWVEFALRFLSSAYFFFGNNKKGSVSPMDISDLAPEKREGEFTKKKWGRVGRQRVFWAEKLSWAAFILFDFVHRSNSIFLS